MLDLKQLKLSAKDISILYVEDNEDIRKAFSKYLSKIFDHITVCENGLEGLEKYEEKIFDIIITDINMPLLDGLSMSKKIKEIDEYQHIIIVSAYKEIENYMEAINIGVEGYILKPIQYHQVNLLLYKIITQINSYKLNEEYKNNLKKLVEIKTEEIKKQYITDRLTGLKNRALLDKNLLSKNIKTLILLNIDNFNMLNNSYGFSFSDDILIEVSRLLEKFESEKFVLYRLQADVFAFLAQDEALEEAKEIAQDIKDFFNKNSLTIQNVLINLTFSIAIDYGLNKDLLKTANLTIQELREIDKNKIGIYNKDSEFEKKQKNNLYNINKIREYLNNEQLTIHFQAIKDIKKDEITKYEVLARIYSSDDGIIMPNEFLKPIQLAGLMAEFTKKIIDKAFMFLQNKDITISINITEQDLKENYLIDYLKEKTSQYNISEKQVILEILESISISNDHLILEQLEKLKNMGFVLAIDDFGSENSNFSRLLQLNVDFIKIDGSFIKEIQTNKNSQEIVKSILTFSHNLGYKVIAEYVCSEEIYHIIQELGVDYAQGYYIGKPKEKLGE